MLIYRTVKTLVNGSYSAENFSLFMKVWDWNSLKICTKYKYVQPFIMLFRKLPYVYLITKSLTW